MLRVLSNHITAHMNTSKLGLSHTFKCPEAFANCLKGIKNDLANCLFFFKIVLNAPGGLNFPKDKKKIKDGGPYFVGGVPRKLFAEIH